MFFNDTKKSVEERVVLEEERVDLKDKRVKVNFERLMIYAIKK